MKTSLIICFFSLFSIGLAGQSTNPLDKFVGTWRWTSNSDTLLLFIKKDVLNVTNEVVIGCHKYVKNGVVEQAFWPNNLNEVTVTNRRTLYANTKISSPDTALGIIKDIPRKCFVELLLTYNSAGQINFSIKSLQGIQLDGINGPFRLPNNVTLTKL